MYKIMMGSTTIYDSSDKVTYPVSGATLSLSLNDAGSLDFVVYPGHPSYEALKQMHSIIAAYRDDEEIFYGRVMTAEFSMDRQMSVGCEGALTFLMDSELEKVEAKETARAFLQRCLTSHNSQVEEAKQFYVGNITVERALRKEESSQNETKWKFNNNGYTQTKSVVENMLLGQFGGYLRVRKRPEGGHYLDWLESYGRTNTQPIKIAENIEDKSDRLSGENIFTILRPFGKTTKNKALDISALSQADISLPNVTKRGNTLRLDNLIAQYGSIIHTETFSTAEKAKDLLKEAEDYIRKYGSGVPASTDITFVDFYHLNNEIMDVRLGDTFTTIEGFDGVVMTVGEINLDLENPANDSMTLKNMEELNASSSGSSGGSSLTKASSSYYNNSNFRYRYIHEKNNYLQLATEEIDIAASKKFELLANQAILTVEDKPGSPGKMVLSAKKKIADPDGSEIVMTVGGIDLSASGVDLEGYATKGEIEITNEQVALRVTKGEVATQLAVEAGNVSIRNGNLVVDGYVTAQAMTALRGEFEDLTAGRATANQLKAKTIVATNVITGPTITATNAVFTNLTATNTTLHGHSISFDTVAVNGQTIKYVKWG